MCGMAEKQRRKKWDDKDMVGAMEAVRNKTLGRALDPRANGTWLSKLTE